MAKRKVHYSFKNGLNCLTSPQLAAVKAEIMEVLGDITEARYYQIRRDYPNIPAYRKEEIDNIFLRYGVSESEVWQIWE